jgi:hypothetical protein
MRKVCVLVLAMTMTAATPVFAAEMAGDPYTLGTCPISGKALDSDAVVKTYDGGEVRFCCNGCVSKFEKDQEAQQAKIDAAVIKQQKAHYPLTTCVVGGGEMKEGKAVDVVYKNRHVRLCCANCEDALKADPATFLSKIDEAVVEQQSESYPLTTCPVSGEALDSMGGPVNIVVANRLVQVCCKGCTKKVKADPAAMLSKLDSGATEPATEPEGS